MENTPQIRLIFTLTKNDSNDFDRDDVTRRLGITPSKTSEPIVSKGKIFCESDIHEVECELPGITILPTEKLPYQMLLHAHWSVELPKIKCWELSEPLEQLEKLFMGKELDVLNVCKEYNLSADMIVRVFAESNNMPELRVDYSSLSFWASMGVSLNFDFYLD